MKNKASFFYIILCLPLLAYANDHSAQVQDWLKKMHRAAHTLNYEGTFVYGQKDNLSSMRIIHSASEKEEKERLVSMDGSGREVIRKGNSVTCILPDTQTVVVEKSRPTSQFPPMFPTSIERLTPNYDFKIVDGSRVAGRQTQEIIITPKDNMRYGHHLWVDKETGLLLKTYLLNEKANKLEQFMFTQINFFDQIPPDWLMPAVSGKDFNWYEAEASKPGTARTQSDWEVSKLPKGFLPDLQKQHMTPQNGMPVEHMVFSDGLSSISVFIEKDMNSKDNLVGSSHMGAVHAHGHKMDGYHVTVVGEAPLASIKMISQSVIKK